jgi:hypothetical protein
MDDASRVDVAHCLQNAPHYGTRFFISELSISILFHFDELRELPSLHEFHSQKYSPSNLSYL